MNLLYINLNQYLDIRSTNINQYNMRQDGNEAAIWSRTILGQWVGTNPLNYYTSILLERKLKELNFYLSPNRSFQYFLRKCSKVTYQFSMWMTQNPINEPLYMELRSRFVVMVTTILFLLQEQDPEELIRTYCTEQQFIDIINALKLIDVMLAIKKEKVEVPLPIQDIQAIQDSILYQTILVLKLKHSKMTNIIAQPISKQLVAEIVWITLYELQLHKSIKKQLYRDVKENLQIQ